MSVHTPQRATAVAVAGLLLAGSAGCSRPADADAADERPPGHLTVVLATGGGFADAPSSYTTLVHRAGTGRTSASSVVAARLDDAGRTLLRADLPSGTYVVEVSQRGCGMHGGDCPEDPSDAEHSDPTWVCAVALTVLSEESWRVVVGDGDDPARTDDTSCPATRG